MNISNTDDIIDTRDIIERIEELEVIDLENLADLEEIEELGILQAFMHNLEGFGQNEQWRGDWYPVMCIRDSYFKVYAQELADDIGAVDDDQVWPYNCIDWNQAARQLQIDYASVELGGVTYWVR